MESSKVLVRFRPQGELTVLSFTRGGRVFNVEDTGRQWLAEDGLHVLVMAGRQVYELVFQPERGGWFLKPRPGAPSTV